MLGLPSQGSPGWQHSFAPPLFGLSLGSDSLFPFPFSSLPLPPRKHMHTHTHTCAPSKGWACLRNLGVDTHLMEEKVVLELCSSLRQCASKVSLRSVPVSGSILPTLGHWLYICHSIHQWASKSGHYSCPVLFNFFWVGRDETTGWLVKASSHIQQVCTSTIV